MSSANCLTPKEWSHVAVTVTPQRVAIYLDGELSGEGAWEGALTPRGIAPVIFVLGNAVAYDTKRINAYLQDFRAYNYALDSSEIASTMDLAGIPTVKAEEDGFEEYYNLQGIRVDNPGKGIFIRRTANTTEKVRFN